MIDDHGAIVADIFLDALTDTVLEVGTGDFNTIYVIVPDGAGGFEVATGGVYAYYEFWQPRTDRLTDEAWWLFIEGETLPDRPWWVGEHLGL
jgi:pyridoxine/pyridoxamine 5'-phosphate oxidase